MPQEREEPREREDEDVEEEETEEAEETEGEGEPEKPEKDVETRPMRELRRAHRAQKKRADELERKFGTLESTLKQTQGSYETLVSRLKAVAGGDAEKEEDAETGINPHDPSLEPDEYKAWDAAERKRMRDEIRAEREAEKQQGQQATARTRQQAILKASDRSTEEFQTRHPTLKEDDVWQDADGNMTPFAQRVNMMAHRGMGTGENGALTVEDIEGVAHAMGDTRSLIAASQQTLGVRQKEREMMEGLKGAQEQRGGGRGTPRSTPDNPLELDDPELEQLLVRLEESGDTKQAAKIIDDLARTDSRRLEGLHF